MTDQGMQGLALIVLLLAIYFLPSLIGRNRRHPSIGGIFVVNLFFGWTLLGWVVALAWAASGRTSSAVHLPDQKPLVRQTAMPSISMDRWITRVDDHQTDGPKLARSFPCPSCREPVIRLSRFCASCGSGLDWN